MLPEGTNNNHMASKLKKTQTTFQPANLSCPFKVDVFGTDLSLNPPKDFVVLVCITNSRDLESTAEMQTAIDAAVLADGWSAINYAL